MMAKLRARLEVYEGEKFTSLDQIILNNGVALTPSDVTAKVELQVFDMSSTEIDFASLDAADVLFDLTVDGYWDVDAIGYNFRHTYDTSLIPLIGGRRYTVIYIVRTEEFGPKYVITDLSVKEVAGVDTFGV